MPLSLEQIARALNGRIIGDRVRAPGPGHSQSDDSLSVMLDKTGGDVIVTSFAQDDWRTCKDYVRDKLGIFRRDHGSDSDASPIQRAAPKAPRTLSERIGNPRGEQRRPRCQSRRARVLLLKSDNPRKESQMSLQQIISKSFELRARNKLDKFTLAKLHQDRATELGMTLAKYYDTAEGRQAQTDAVSAEHYEQVVTSSGDGYARVAKARRNRETKEPVAMGEHAIHHDDPGEDRRDNDGVEEWEKYVGDYRTKYKLDKHRAYDAAMKSPKGQALFARAKSGASYPVDDL